MKFAKSILVFILVFIINFHPAEASPPYTFTVNTQESKLTLEISATVDILSLTIGSDEKEITLAGNFLAVYQPVVGNFETVSITAMSINSLENYNHTFSYDYDNANITINVSVEDISLNLTRPSDIVTIDSSGQANVDGHKFVLTGNLIYSYEIKFKFGGIVITGGETEAIEESFEEEFPYTTEPHLSVHPGNTVKGSCAMGFHTHNKKDDNIDLSLDFGFDIQGYATAPQGNAVKDQWQFYE